MYVDNNFPFFILFLQSATTTESKTYDVLDDMDMQIRGKCFSPTRLAVNSEMLRLGLNNKGTNKNHIGIILTDVVIAILFTISE